MEIEILKVLAELPTTIILIYLLVRAQGQTEKLLAGIIEIEREHAKSLVNIICSGSTSKEDRAFISEYFDRLIELEKSLPVRKEIHP